MCNHLVEAAERVSDLTRRISGHVGRCVGRLGKHRLAVAVHGNRVLRVSPESVGLRAHDAAWPKGVLHQLEVRLLEKRNGWTCKIN